MREAELPARLVEEAAALARPACARPSPNNVDRFAEKYLETGTLTEEDLQSGHPRADASPTRPCPCSAVPRCGASASSRCSTPCAIICPRRSKCRRSSATDPDDAGEEDRAQAATEDEPLAALAFKVATDRYDELVYVRVYSGVLRSRPARVQPAPRPEGIRRAHVPHVREPQRRDRHRGRARRDRRRQRPRAHRHRRHALRTDRPDPARADAVPLNRRQHGHRAAHPGRPRQASRERSRKLTREDPTFDVKNDPETGQLVISGMGELHSKSSRTACSMTSASQANVGEPRVAYKETIAGETRSGRAHHPADRHARHLRRGASCASSPPRCAAKFASSTSFPPQKIKRRFIHGDRDRRHGDRARRRGHRLPADQRRSHAARRRGASHPTPTTWPSKAAASMAMRQAVEEGGAVLLEPIMSLEVVAPAQYLGDIIADLNSRRAEITHVEERGELRVVAATVPLSEMFGYATALRSVTQGAGHTLWSRATTVPRPKKVYDRWVV